MRRFASMAVLSAAAVLCLSKAAPVPVSSEIQLVVEANPNAADLRCPPAARGGTMRSRPPQPDSLKQLHAAAKSNELSALDADKLGGFSLPSVDPITKERLSSSQPLRIGIWGDSHIAGGIITDELRRILNSRGLDVQAGFLPPTMGRIGVAGLPVRKFCLSPQWALETAYASKTPVATGLGLARQRSTGRKAYLWLDLRDETRQPTLASVSVQYLATAQPTVVEISVDDGPARRVTVATAAANADGFSSILITGRHGPISTIKLTVIDGTFDLQGFRLTHQRPAQVTLDVFGIPSATARGWSRANSNLLREAGASYGAVVLEYGTNEGNAPNYDRASYRADMIDSLTAMRRAFPSASCLLIGPADRGVRYQPTIRYKGRTIVRHNPRRVDRLKFSKIHAEITAVQAEVGAMFACQTWSWQGLMGGTGGAYTWASANPPLMGSDLTHLTAPGYRTTAQALAIALGWTVNSGY